MDIRIFVLFVVISCTATISVLDDHYWPSNKYQDDFPSGTIERSVCPDVSSMCGDMDTSWCHETAQTYFYLEDGTKCHGCSECIPEPPKVECPPVLCPMWNFPMNCKNPSLFSLYIDYEGKECRACEMFYCLE